MHFKAAKYEKQKPVSRNQCFKEGNDKSDKKTSQLGWCFESFTLHDLFVAANSREHVYFQQQIVALLLIHETHNLSSIKFTHVSQQTDGLCTCISWSSLKAYRMKLSMLQQKQPWIRIKKNNFTGAIIGYDLISCS